MMNDSGENVTLTSEWSINLISDDSVTMFAAQELCTMLQRIGGPRLPVVRHSDRKPCITMHCGEGGDGFAYYPDANGFMMRGSGPRGLLYAVYDLLEQLGCRWVAPGASGERLPHYDYVVLPRQVVQQQPALAGRCLVIGHDFFLDEAEAWIVWAARNRLNTLFVHTIDRPLALGACHLKLWRMRRAHLLPLLHERGMHLEVGGHGMASLIPRRLFGTMPQIFRYDGSRRVVDYNFCPSSVGAQNLLRGNGAAFFRSYPEAHVFHVWPDDIHGGGWCNCSRCRHLSPADQALLATNELAEVLDSINPYARLSHLAYHDTMGAPMHVVPRSNVVLLYAPRERSYAHGIGNSENPINNGYARHLQDAIAAFQCVSAGPAALEHRVFEYYLDGILFKSAPPPLLSVIQEDMRAYRDAGVHMVQALMTGDRPWLVAPLNAYLFARLAWEPEQDVHALVEDYAAIHMKECATRVQSSLSLVKAYYTLAEAWQPVLDVEQGECVVKPMLQKRRDLLAHPPTDVLDYMGAPMSLRQKHLVLLDPVNGLLEQAQTTWDDVLCQENLPNMEHAWAEWKVGVLLLRFMVFRQQLAVLEGREAPRVMLLAAMKDAQSALDALVEWGETHLPTRRAKATYRLLRMGQQLHLDALRNRTLAGPWERIWLRVRDYAWLAWFASHVVRL